MDFYLMRKLPLAGLTNLLSNMPSNITEYLATRVLDTKEREENILLRWSINVNESKGLDQMRLPYANMDPAFVKSIIIALNRTITKNMFREDPAYIQLKQKYYSELMSKYHDWYYNRKYYQGKDIEKKANVAAMALIFGELSSIGPDEQVLVKKEVKSIYDQCIDRAAEERNLLRCLELPESSEWKKEHVDKTLPGVVWKGKKQFIKLLFAIRSKSNYFKNEDGKIDISNIGYFFHNKRDSKFFKEEKDQFDWTQVIIPTF